jgi:hypothetical protein
LGLASERTLLRAGMQQSSIWKLPNFFEKPLVGRTATLSAVPFHLVHLGLSLTDFDAHALLSQAIAVPIGRAWQYVPKVPPFCIFLTFPLKQLSSHLWRMAGALGVMFKTRPRL